ncbi:MAG: UDP binding domain-containing protein, partial [Ferruginibacter sp.]
DPYYLTYKSRQLGYDSQVILAGRVINDGMAGYVAKKVLQHIIQNNGNIKDAKVLVMGATFKENVSDIRNSKVADVVKELKSYSLNVDITDPYAESDELKHEYGFSLSQHLEKDYDAVLITVPHNDYKELDDAYFAGITKPTAMIADLKGIFRGKISSRRYWSL